MPSLSPVAGVRNAGSLFALFLDVRRMLFKRPFQSREVIQQAWFVAGVTILPTMLVSIPFGAVAQLPDLWTGEIKAFIFGIIAGVVAAYKGLNAGGGPKGVGDAVNQSVVITFLLLFFTNFVITAVYFQVVPAKGQ